MKYIGKRSVDPDYEIRGIILCNPYVLGSIVSELDAGSSDPDITVHVAGKGAITLLKNDLFAAWQALSPVEQKYWKVNAWSEGSLPPTT